MKENEYRFNCRRLKGFRWKVHIKGCLTTLRLSVNFPRWGLELQSFGLTGDRVARFSGRKMPENEAKVAILENFNDFFGKIVY